MTVKEVFELRKQGRIEEAYDAIRPMYAAHKGRYTTLCMFWTAADVFKLRLEQGTQKQKSKKEEMPSGKDSFNSSNSCSKKEELTNNSRQLMSKEESPQGKNICVIRDICVPYNP